MRKLFKRLHVFDDGYTHVVAHDPDDAAAVYIEWTGCSLDDIDDNPFEPVPDKAIIKVGYDRADIEARKWWWWPPFAKAHPEGDFPYISAPAWLWALWSGRGVLCSQDF